MTIIMNDQLAKSYIDGFNEEIRKAKVEEIQKTSIEEVQKDKAKVEAIKKTENQEDSRQHGINDADKVLAYREGLIRSGISGEKLYQMEQINRSRVLELNNKEEAYACGFSDGDREKIAELLRDEGITR